MNKACIFTTDVIRGYFSTRFAATESFHGTPLRCLYIQAPRPYPETFL